MEFNKTVCQNFFDFSRELNESDGIIQNIYNIIQYYKFKDEGLFYGMEKRLTRASHACRDADDFIKLAKTCFRNQKVRTNEKREYLALLFYTGEWLNEQARLFVQDVKLHAVTDTIILSMALILTNDLNFRSRADWYDLRRPLRISENDNFNLWPFFLGISAFALIKVLK